MKNGPPDEAAVHQVHQDGTAEIVSNDTEGMITISSKDDGYYVQASK